jgi:hypothetical protein
MGLRSKYRWWASGGAILALVPLVADWAVAKVFDRPREVIEFAQLVFGDQGFFWFVFAACGLALGAWLDLLFERFDKQRFSGLVTDIRGFNAEMLQERALTSDRRLMLLGQAAAIERQLEDRSIATLVSSDRTTPEETLVKLSSIYLQIEPYLREGNSRKASEIIIHFNTIESEKDAQTPHQDALPDITLNDLIVRIMENRNTPDDGSLTSLKIAREIGQEIGDQISLRKITTWMRVTAALDKVPHRIAKTGFGVGRNSAGEISCLKTYPTGPDSTRNVSDIRFNLDEIREVWPDI